MKVRSWLLAVIVVTCVLVPIDLLAAQPSGRQKTDTTPVRQIGVYVLPFYRSSDTPDGHPDVRIAKAYNALLASNRKEDILSAEAGIESKPQLITPMTLMVLAIRMYDVGLRDRGVFWFYVAKDRYITLTKVIDGNSPGLNGVDDAVKSFAILAGPYFNSYAFCDPARQYQLAQDAIDWVEKNPYQAIYMEQLAPLPGDRTTNLKHSIDGIRESIAKEHSELSDPAKVEWMRNARKANHVDEQFCWKN